MSSMMQGAPSLKMGCVTDKSRKRSPRKSAAVELPDDVVERLAELLPADALEGRWRALRPTRSPARAG